jgi:outer membrane protein assembly factor BamB
MVPATRGLDLPTKTAFVLLRGEDMKTTANCLLVLFLVIGSTAIAQQPCSSGPPPRAVIDWSEFRFDLCHAGFNPYEFVLSPATVGGLRELWSYNVGDTVWSSPAVANGTVYFGSDDHNLYALDSHTGALRWTYPTAASIWSSPAVADGVVYFGAGTTYDPGDYSVYALNATTGALLWKYTTGGNVQSSPAVAEGVMYAASADGNLYALNASTGALVWKYTGVTGLGLRRR